MIIYVQINLLLVQAPSWLAFSSTQWKERTKCTEKFHELLSRRDLAYPSDNSYQA